jgi:hypothetical protein
MSNWINAVNLIGVGFIGQTAIHVLEFLFAAGIIGSAIVVAITFIEDLKEVFSNDEPAHGHAVVRETHGEAVSVR